jgi:hypothetical protein
MQVFTGHAETTPLGLMLKDNVPVNAPLDFIKAQKLMEVEKLSKAVTEIHAEVTDYVLVAEHRKSGMSKLQVKWRGSRRVASVESDYVFVVENLLTKELKAAHDTFEIL